MGAPPRTSGPRACLVVAPERAPAVADTLARAGLAPTCAATEREALEALRGGGDLAAIYVAGALGPTAVAALAAASGQRGDAPLVVLGAKGTVQEAVDAMQLGAADYVAPPYAAEDLVRRLAP